MHTILNNFLFIFDVQSANNVCLYFAVDKPPISSCLLQLNLTIASASTSYLFSMYKVLIVFVYTLLLISQHIRVVCCN